MIMDIVFTAVHAVIFATFFEFRYRDRRGRNRNKLLTPLLALLYVITVASVNYVESFFLNLVVNVIMIFGFGITISKDIQRALTATAYVFSMAFLSEEIVIYVRAIFLQQDISVSNPTHYIAGFAILIAFLVLFAKISPVYNYRRMPTLFFVVDLIYPAFIIVMTKVLTATLPAMDHPVASIVAIIVLPLMLFATIVAHAILHRHFMRLYAIQEEVSSYNNDFQKSIRETFDQQSSYLKRRIERYNMLQNLKNGNAQAVIDELEKDKLISHTGVLGVDTVMNYAAQEAAEKGIRIEFEYSADNNIRIGDHKLHFIVGHIIESAISAVTAIDNPSDEDMVIIASLHLGINLFTFTVNNAYTGAIEWDKNHYPLSVAGCPGYDSDLETIDQIVKLHDGEITFAKEDQRLIVDILLYQSIE